jgi:hypothetical protein
MYEAVMMMKKKKISPRLIPDSFLLHDRSPLQLFACQLCGPLAVAYPLPNMLEAARLALGVTPGLIARTRVTERTALLEKLLPSLIQVS